MSALEFIREHVTFKLPYDFSYQMKTPYTSSNIDIFSVQTKGFKHSVIWISRSRRMLLFTYMMFFSWQTENLKPFVISKQTSECVLWFDQQQKIEWI